VNKLAVLSLLLILLIPVNAASAQSWPGWFSQVEQWAGDGLISQQEFDRALEYLVKNDIVLEEHPDILHESENQEITYANIVVNKQPIKLRGNDILEIIDTNYTHTGNIMLEDNAKLIIKNSLIEHKKDFSMQYTLTAKGNSQVIVENSIVQTECNGSFNWNFFDDSSFTATNMEEGSCNLWRLFADDSKAMIKDSVFRGGGFSTCDRAVSEIENSVDIEVELCYGEGAIVDTVLPTEIIDFTFPNEGAKNINSVTHLKNSTIDGWGIGVPPNSDITIRDTPAVTVSIIIGLPLENEIIELDDLNRKLYSDKTWQIADAKLRLVNTKIYGWEPNVFANQNTLIIKDSNFSGATMNSDHSKQIIENSTVDLVRAQEFVEIIVKDSVINGDVIATDDSKITLINTVVKGKIIEEDNGKVIIQ